jgi:hypothetical protein
MSSPASEVASILENQSSLGLRLARNLFVSEMPNDPAAAVALYDAGGQSPDPVQDYRRPSVQVRIRGAQSGFQMAYQMAERIRNILHGLHGVSAGPNVRYLSIFAEGEPGLVGYDDNRRPILTCNFSCQRTEG